MEIRWQLGHTIFWMAMHWNTGQWLLLSREAQEEQADDDGQRGLGEEELSGAAAKKRKSVGPCFIISYNLRRFDCSSSFRGCILKRFQSRCRSLPHNNQPH